MRPPEQQPEACPCTHYGGVVFLIILTAVALLPQPFKGRFSTVGLLHDCVHLAAFFVAFLLTSWRGCSLRQAATRAAVLFVFGVALEIVETRFYGNRLEYRD